MTDDLDGIYDLYEMSYSEMTANLSPSNNTVEEVTRLLKSLKNGRQ